MPLLKRTLVTFLKAELGYLGVAVKTLRQTPLLKGDGCFLGLFFRVLKLKLVAGVLLFFIFLFLPFLIN